MEEERGMLRFECFFRDRALFWREMVLRCGGKWSMNWFGSTGPAFMLHALLGFFFFFETILGLFVYYTV